MSWRLVLPVTLLAFVYLAPVADAQKKTAQDVQKKTEKDVPKKAEKAAPDKVKAPRPLTIADSEQWERIVSFEVSPNGQWIGYFQRPNEGDGKIWIKQRDGDKAYEYTVGPGSGSVTFSHDSRWVAFRVGTLDKEAKAARKAKKPVRSKVFLVALDTNEKTEFENAGSFTFSGELTKYLAIQKAGAAEERPSPPSDDAASGRDLILYELETGHELNFGNVSSYAFNKPGKWLTMVIDAEGKSGNGVQLLEVATNRLSVLESDKARYRDLNWTKEGDAFALLKVVEDKDYEDKLHQVIAYRDLSDPQPTRVHIDPAQDAGIPDNMTISPYRTPTWTEERDALLFGIHEPKAKKKEEDADESKTGDKGEGAGRKPAAGKDEEEEEADLVIWHWKDKRLQSRQQVQETQDKRFNYLCIHRVEEKKTFRLADDEMRRVTPLKPHRYALAFDDTKYELSGNLNGRRFNDVYTIDLRTGKKKLAHKKVRWMMGAAPTGDQFLYFEDGHYHVYSMVTGKSRNITEDAPVSFVDEEDDHNVKQPPIRPIDWSADGHWLLLYDNWDVWRVPVGGGEPVNLTERGREDGIRFGSRYRLDPDEEGIDLSQPIYLRAFGEWTKKSGIARITNGQPGAEMLIWEDAMVSGLNKVKDQEVYYYTKESESQSPNFFVGGSDLVSARRVTDSNPQQKDFLWSDGAKLIEYKSKQGQRLQAALFLPANYVEGKRYPTVVYIYEKLSQRLHRYDAPRTGGFSTSVYTSRGYAVLMPDIVYRLNQPGISAVECVLPALDAAVESGVVDPDRVGLHGHSWGGYQTAFLITQTNRFRAAVAGAPLTNLISMYSSIYWNSGVPNQPIFESSQGRFTAGYWKNLTAYAKNSPVYHAQQVTTPLLLLHNDKDGAVDWNQGIEYFNTLRRLQKPVVMLQYKGENHGLAKDPNRKDYSYRMQEFFDHYLRGAEAPEWWKEGIPHLDQKEHIEQHRKKQEDD